MRLAALFLLAFLPACGSSDPRVLTDEGSKALSAGKYEDAAESYEEALALLGNDTLSSDWLRAKLGLIRAHIHLDAGRGTQEFLAFAAAAPTKATDDEFARVAGQLGDARHFKEAQEVLAVGSKAYPESVNLKALGDDLVERAKASGDTEAVDALKGLGYGGGK